MYFTQFYAIIISIKSKEREPPNLEAKEKTNENKKKLREAFRDGFSEGRKRAKENSYRARKNRNTGSSTKRGRT